MNKDLKTAIIIGSMVVAIAVLAPTAGGLLGWNYGYGIMGPGMMGGFGWGWLMLPLFIGFWGLVIWGIVALIRGLSKGRDGSREADSAKEILKRRYARGEIGKQEYEEKLKDLM